jgi:glycerophosphoryl diester phosphodiesterase
MANNHVIFIHPDGTSPSHYALARFVDYGPDGRLNWDNLDNAGVYLGHLQDQLGGTSNAGAVTHATGTKVYAESFGLNEDGSPVESLSGSIGKTIMQEAVTANKVTALIQSGAIYEPGTAAFVAQVGETELDGERVPPRQRRADIAKQVIESGVSFIMGGGELNLLPIGTDGFHGTATEYDALSSSSLARPTENLIELAKSLGYTIVYTEEQLNELLDPSKYPIPPTKVLGVFAPIHTFNDEPEEVLSQDGLPLYKETAPTVAEMLAVTQKLAELHPNFQNGSFTVLEEEGTDNFGNNNNAAGVLEGIRRADAAIGVALEFNQKYSNSLIITAADSDAGGLQVRDPLEPDVPVGSIDNNPTLEPRLIPIDGVNGSNTTPFTTAPDADGDVFNFGVTWAGTPDFSGSIVSKAHGINSDKLPATLDNTKIYELMYETLFDTELEARNPDPIEAPPATEETGNVIFIHPDGTSPSHYMALRNLALGPDGRLNWDMMSDAGVYLGHMENQLTGTSNAGAVTHANGVKVFNESFGLNEDNTPVTPASGNTGLTILEEAIAAGKSIALIQSGHLAEPGTAAFVAETTNRDGDDIRARDKRAEIIEQVIRSGTSVIMGGGELYMLPVGTTGFHVTPELDASDTTPESRPTINLIELAKSLGYTVVYTEEQLNEVMSGEVLPEKLLGVFAAIHTFDDRTEEELGLNTDDPSPLYVETAPTVAEMLDASLKIVEQDPDGFFAVVEEEGTDNFGNNNNAAGTIEALRRADAAIGVAMDYVNNEDPNTLVITAADSDAGGMQTFQFAPYDRPEGNAIETPDLGDTEAEVPFITVNPTLNEDLRNYLDGANGSTASEGFPWASFPSVDSLDGAMGNFSIAWAGTPDFPGSIVSKAYGMNADLLPATLDNTEIYKIMYQTLFGVAPENSAKLVGFSNLPADTFAPGLPGGSGNFIDSENRETPFEGQPVQGFSGVQFAANGNYWFLSDNGFGAKDNSSDYLLRIYEVDPDFKTADGGTGDAQWNSFIQLSDPNNLIPWDIVNEGTTDRLLTGADFDPESFVLAPNGDIWIGEEFGPYLLHFNPAGELLDAPIVTPNKVEFNTLNGQSPIVIGHRGASGSRPEHTLEAYKLAIEQGADFVEPDLVATKDGVLIARHENALATVEIDANGQIVLDANGKPIVTSETTNVATFEKFLDRLAVKSIDGELVGGWFSEDFTLAEIKELRARERIPQIRPDNTQYNDLYEIPTFSEVIDLLKQVEAETGKQVGIYPETKHPTYFQSEGTRIDGTPIDTNLGFNLVSTLVANGFTDPDRIFIQSFEVANLIQLQDTILPLFDPFVTGNLVDIPLVQLYGDVEDAEINAVGGGFSVPYDIAYNFSQTDFDAADALATYGDLVNLVPDFGKDITGDGIPDTTYKDLTNPDVFNYLGENYAEGIGPWKNSFILREALDTPVDGNGDGVAQITSQLTGEIRPYIDWAHAAGMQVHPYTLRNEEPFLTLNPDGTPQTPEQEVEQLINLGVDGFFTDSPATGVTVRDSLGQNFVASPDNPEVLAGNGVANLGRSRGFEGMAYSPDYATLYPLLEGSVTGDPDNALRIYKFDVATQTYAEDIVGFYGLDDPSYAIGDFTPINATEFLVIERDPNQGEEAEFKKVFKVDFSQIDANGFVKKTEVVDLLNLTDPDDLNGDGSKIFTFPFVTIEDILILDEKTLLLANDNNYPFSMGREGDIDNNEIIKIQLPQPLNLAPELGLNQISLSSSPASVTEGGQLTWDFTAAKPVSEDGLVLNLTLDPNSTISPADIEFNVAGSENIASFELIVTDGSIEGAKVTLAAEATTAKLVANIIADKTKEGTESATFTLTTGDDYRIDPDANTSSFTIEDTSQSLFPKTVFGTDGNDLFDAAFPENTQFNGDNQILFTGSGVDYVDVTLAAGRNRIDLGSDEDILLGGNKDRILAGSGDDVMFLGSGEGRNLVTGGEGSDIFWLVTDANDLPEKRSIITDFQPLENDLLGFGNTDLSFDDLTFVQNDGFTLIYALDKKIARLEGIKAIDLQEDDFVFA